MSLPEYRVAVARAMTAISIGDPDGFEELFRLAAKPVRGLIANAFRDVNLDVTADELTELTRTALVDIAGLAGVWRPDGGALPWTWAKQRIIAGAFAGLGSRCDSIDADPDGRLLDIPADQSDWHDESEVEEILTRLAACVPQAALLQDGLSRVASDRDRRVWLVYVAEQATGNPAPAGVVARLTDLSEANVRKIVERVRKGLRALAAEDASFAVLGNFPAVAA